MGATPPTSGEQLLHCPLVAPFSISSRNLFYDNGIFPPWFRLLLELWGWLREHLMRRRNILWKGRPWENPSQRWESFIIMVKYRNLSKRIWVCDHPFPAPRFQHITSKTSNHLSQFTSQYPFKLNLKSFRPVVAYQVFISITFQHQAIQFMLADMAIGIETARLATLKSAYIIDKVRA